MAEDKIRYAIGIYDKNEYREYIHKGLEDGRCSIDELIDMIIYFIEESHRIHKQHMALVDATIETFYNESK